MSNYSESAKQAFEQMDKSLFEWIYFYVDANDPATVVFDSTFTLIFFTPIFLVLTHYLQILYSNPSLTSSIEAPDGFRDAIYDQLNPRDEFFERNDSVDFYSKVDDLVDLEDIEDADDKYNHFTTVDGKPADTSDLSAKAAEQYDEYDEKLTFANRDKQYKEDADVRRTKTVVGLSINGLIGYLKFRRLYFAIVSFFMVISIVFDIAEWQPKSEKLTNALRAQMALNMAMEIHNEKDPLIKLNALDQTLKSGKDLSYTGLRDDDKNESERHQYIVEYDFKDDYTTAIKDLEEGYKNGEYASIETATVLEQLYLNGNEFVEKDSDKHEYYFHQKKAFEQYSKKS